MKAVFRISNRLRAAAPIPRDFLPIPGLDHLGLCYQQKIVTDPAEFNALQSAINDPRFPRRGATIDAYMLTEEDEAKMAPPAPVAAPVAAPAEETTPEPPVEQEIPDVEQTPPTDDRFRVEGNDIFDGDERVARVTDGVLRCAHGKADLRSEIEAFVQKFTY